MASNSYGNFAPSAAPAKARLPIVETPRRVDDDWPAPASLPRIPAKADAGANRVKLLATSLAASIVVAVAVSAAAGSLDARGLMRSAVEYAQAAYNLVDEATALRSIIALQNTPASPPPPPLQSAAEPPNIAALHNTYALQLTVYELQSELSALKAGINAGTRSTNWQFDQIEERLDRIVYEQAEPAAKIAKTIERLDWLEWRIQAVADREATGTIAPRHSAPVPAPRPPVAKPPVRSQRPVVGGWTVSDVYGSTAIIRDSNFITIAVTPGATIPGVGRVDAIRQQNGRWVVVTARGLIVSAY